MQSNSFSPLIFTSGVLIEQWSKTLALSIETRLFKSKFPQQICIWLYVLFSLIRAFFLVHATQMSKYGAFVMADFHKTVSLAANFLVCQI